MSIWRAVYREITDIRRKTTEYPLFFYQQCPYEFFLHLKPIRMRIEMDGGTATFRSSFAGAAENRLDPRGEMFKERRRGYSDNNKYYRL